jgi:Family of unknown function (DUF6573)
VPRPCSAACRSSRAPQSTCRCSCGGATHGAAHTAQGQEPGSSAAGGDDPSGADPPEGGVAGQPTDDDPADGPRAYALEAGDLIEADPDLVRDARFNDPVAFTRAAWQGCVAWNDEDTHKTGVPQDETGRQWDAIWMARQAIRGKAATTPNFGDYDDDQVRFAMLRVPRDQGRIPIDDLDDDEREGLCLVTLKAQCGPDDTGKPAVTIMNADEDWPSMTSRWEARASVEKLLKGVPEKDLAELRAAVEAETDAPFDPEMPYVFEWEGYPIVGTGKEALYLMASVVGLI